MGTPDFAVRPLEMLLGAGVDVPAVITAPDRKKGRGRLLAPPPVKEAALRLGLNVLQPVSVRPPEFLEELKRLAPDFLVVVAYGRILPKEVLAAPKYLAVNIHPSLLPKYRGPAPLNWAIVNGDDISGVTVMAMDAGVDTGGIILQEESPVLPEDTAGSLGKRLSEEGGRLLVEALNGVYEGSLEPRPQEGEPSFAPMLKKDDGRIKWNESAAAIERLVRGMYPWPGAFTFLGASRIKVLQASLGPETCELPGTVLESPQDTLLLATGSGSIYLTRLQGASGKILPASDFLRGHPVPKGSVFS
ncbi:MAG: methionyl-tRNA formyltransferase [Deltaproteobacteria bacterium]|nr:methionyl-tRNA formyltransferase [Deltaproteobacteria bacterium]